MSRKQVTRSKYIVRQPDPRYSSTLVTLMINMIMNHGKRAGNKSLCTKMVYAAIRQAVPKCQSSDALTEYLQHFNPPVSTMPKDVAIELAIFLYLVNVARPEVEVKSRRIGGANYQVPSQVPEVRGYSMALRMIIENAQKRSGNGGFIEKLRDELVDISFNRGGTLRAKENIKRMALANMVFARVSDSAHIAS